MSEKLKVYAIETDKGYYISLTLGESYSSYNYLDGKLFDGISAKPTFHSQWRLIDKIPEKITHIEKQPNINYRFILADDKLASENIPLEIKREDAGEFQKDCNDNSVFVWKDEYAMYRSLYVEVSDPQPDKVVEDDFEFNVIMKVSDIKPPPEIKYSVKPRYDSYSSKMVYENITNYDVHHQLLDKIIFPNIVLPETPCQLSADDLFKVIRQYVKDNIDPRVAKITSDYDFHFEVKKRIPITKPYQSTYEHSRRGRRRPEMRTVTVSEKEQTIFVITTSSSHTYGSAIVLKPFEAKTEADLKEQVDIYLKDLITFINEPVKECPTCLGVGCLFNEKFTKELK